MIDDEKLGVQKKYLANLIVAIEHCIFFLEASANKQNWPLKAQFLADNSTNVELFEQLSAINERFLKLQDILAAAMRHGVLLAAEPLGDFLKVLSFYEKIGVVHSINRWQIYRTIRNLATHNYETDYKSIVQHFNTLKTMITPLKEEATRFINYCQQTLNIEKK